MGGVGLCFNTRVTCCSVFLIGYFKETLIFLASKMSLRYCFTYLSIFMSARALSSSPKIFVHIIFL